jgi:hypothetical protein
MITVYGPCVLSEHSRRHPVDASRETSPAGPPKPRLLDRVRDAICARHYSRRTEKVYVHWISAIHLLPR